MKIFVSVLLVCLVALTAYVGWVVTRLHVEKHTGQRVDQRRLFLKRILVFVLFVLIINTLGYSAYVLDVVLR